MIRTEHIVKSFDGRRVLDDISIDFETGKTTSSSAAAVRARPCC